jgi:hypothetical protein
MNIRIIYSEAQKQSDHASDVERYAFKRRRHFDGYGAAPHAAGAAALIYRLVMALTLKRDALHRLLSGLMITKRSEHQDQIS